MVAGMVLGGVVVGNAPIDVVVEPEADRPGDTGPGSARGGKAEHPATTAAPTAPTATTDNTTAARTKYDETDRCLKKAYDRTRVNVVDAGIIKSLQSLTLRKGQSSSPGQSTMLRDR